MLDRAARARVDRARPAAAALGVRAAVRDRRRRGGRRDRRRGRARPLAGRVLGAYSVDDERRLPGLAGARVDRATTSPSSTSTLCVLPVRGAHRARRDARHLDRRLRVFAAASASLSVWLVLEVGGVRVAATRSAIEERNLFYLAPLFVIALLAWIERGQPRPPRAAVAAAGVAAALAGRDPVRAPAEHHGRVRHARAAAVVVRRTTCWTGDAGIGVAAVALAIALARVVPLAAAAVRAVAARARRARLSLHVAPRRAVDAQLPAARDGALPPGNRQRRTSWIDAAVGRNAHVGVVWAGGNDLAVWENEFFNRSVDRVYGLGARLPGRHAGDATSVDPATGVLPRRRTSAYVLAPASVQLVGHASRAPIREAARPLPRRRRPRAITTRVAGLYPTTRASRRGPARTSTGSRFELHRRHARRRGLERPEALPEAPQTLADSRGTTSAQTFVDRARGTTDRSFACRSRRGNGVCRVDFTVSPTRGRPGASREHRHAAARRCTSRRSSTRREDRRRRQPAVARANGRRQLHPRLARGARRGGGGRARDRRVRADEPAPGRRAIPRRSTASTSSAACRCCRPRTRWRTAVVGAGTPPAERFLGAFDVLHFSDWMYPPQRAGVRSTMIHDLVPLHFPEWVHARTRSMHGAKYRHAARTCDVVVRQLARSPPTTSRRRSASTARAHPRRASGRRRRVRAGRAGAPTSGGRTCSRSRRSSRARTSARSSTRAALLGGELRSRSSAAQGWGEQPRLDGRGVTSARLRRRRGARAALPRRGRRRLPVALRGLRDADRSRRWRAASPCVVSVAPVARRGLRRRGRARRSGEPGGDRGGDRARRSRGATSSSRRGPRARAPVHLAARRRGHPRGLGGRAMRVALDVDAARADARRHGALRPRAAAALSST